MTMVHIGNIIHQELAKQRRSVSWLAGELYTDRTNMYRILKKDNLDTDLLRRISSPFTTTFSNIIPKNWNRRRAFVAYLTTKCDS